jgi:hypothetical protein
VQAAASVTADPVNPYGPDDPGYGPPAPGWQHQDRPAEPAPADHDLPPEPTEARDPFQPLTRHGEEAAAAGRPGDLPAETWEGPGVSALPDEADLGSHVEHFDYEFPAFTADLPAGSAAGAVGQLKGLYMAAAQARPESFDKHFDQLLERQRKLISEYFKQSGGPGGAMHPAGPATVTAPSRPDDGTLAGSSGDHWHAR